MSVNKATSIYTFSIICPGSYFDAACLYVERVVGEVQSTVGLGLHRWDVEDTAIIVNHR